MEPEVEAALAADGTIDFTTYGARTGVARRTEIWFLCLDGRVFVTGTPGRRNWYANLLAHDRCTVHLKESIEADLEATAVPVTDTQLRRWVFDRRHPWIDWYRSQASLDALIRDAPMVELSFAQNDE